MARKRGIDTVCAALLAGKSKRDGNVSTDGSVLFSYAMPIAKLVKGKAVIIRHEDSPSRTTTKHRNAVAYNLHMSGIKYTEVPASKLD
jgi:hypothetical protein